MDAKQAMRRFWGAVGIWGLVCTVVVALASDGRPLLHPAINMVAVTGPSVVVLILFGLWRAKVVEGRIDAVTEVVMQALTELAQLRQELDGRDATIYRDFHRRMVNFGRVLEDMKGWMMRPAVPRGPVRMSAAALAARQEATAVLPTLAQPPPREEEVVVSPEMEAEIRGFLSRENLEGDDTDN